MSSGRRWMCAIVVASLDMTGLACRSEPPANGAPASATRGKERAPEPPATVLEYTATDYHFEGPREAPAGRALFRLTNQGAEPHHLVVVRMERGRTYDSLMAALRIPGPPPPWIRALGGPNAVSPGGEGNAEEHLEPGHYAVLCFIPTADGVPHLAKGMVSPLEVTGSAVAENRIPTHDGLITLSDYDFVVAPELKPGHHVLRVENRGPQLHEVVLARLGAGRRMEDLVNWELSGRRGAAPAQYLGGIAPLGPGEHAQFSITLKPGEYALLCFIPDAADGKPHTAHGMAKRFRVG